MSAPIRSYRIFCHEVRRDGSIVTPSWRRAATDDWTPEEPTEALTAPLFDSLAPRRHKAVQSILHMLG